MNFNKLYSVNGFFSCLISRDLGRGWRGKHKVVGPQAALQHNTHEFPQQQKQKHNVTYLFFLLNNSTTVHKEKKERKHIGMISKLNLISRFSTQTR